MKDLEAILSGGFVFALIGVGGWVVILLLMRGFLMSIQFLLFLIKTSDRLTRENPYIVAHRNILIEKEHFNEYMEEVKKHEGQDLSV